MRAPAEALVNWGWLAGHTAAIAHLTLEHVRLTAIALGIGLVISCIVVFLAAMITSTEGLGHLLVTAARTFQAVDMFVPLITISLLGLILNGLLQAVRSYLLRGFPEV